MYIVDVELKDGPIEQSQADISFWTMITIIPINVAFEFKQ
jgi:hypothetical protein